MKYGYGYVVRWLTEGGDAVRSRSESGFPTEHAADLALEAVFASLERQELLVIEQFVGIVAPDGVTIRPWDDTHGCHGCEGDGVAL